MVDANDLIGSIPSELGKLTQLQSLYLADNELTGSIPSELGEIRFLRKLELRNNKLSGTIPSEFLTYPFLSKLRKWQFPSMYFHFIMPPSHATLTMPSSSPPIDVFDLTNNKLSGSIPRDIALMGNLSTFVVLFRRMSTLACSCPLDSCTILSFALFLQTNPAEIWLNDNDLTGSLPEELFGHRTLGK